MAEWLVRDGFRGGVTVHGFIRAARRCSEEDISKSKRVQAVLREIRSRAGPRVDGSGNPVTAEALALWKVHIVSRNTFPTAAGLASSAAGYACLVHTLCDVYAVSEAYPGGVLCWRCDAGW